MKYHFKFYHLLLVPVLAIGIVGCGKDDDNNSVAQAPAPVTQPSIANWQTIVAMSGCDFNVIRPLSPTNDLAREMINDGNGLSAANTVPTPGNASDAVPMPGNASDSVPMPGNASDNTPSPGLNVAAFQCTGNTARTITLSRNGQFSFANGQQGTLSQPELDQINIYARGLGNVAPANVSCETDATVKSNQITYVTTDASARTYLYVSDATGTRQCFLGTRDQALGLQQAVQKVVSDHMNGGGR